MPSPARRAHARSRLYRLLAVAFSHPDADLHAGLQDGSFQGAVDEAMKDVTGEVSGLPRVTTAFEEYEAQYIDLFLLGNHGRPHVPLHAGDYDEILDGEPRPDFMLAYSKWYRYFGVRTQQDASIADLPDHLTCQLEFLAWLSELEAGAVLGSPGQVGYQRAQRDFMERQMQPFLALIAGRLPEKISHCVADPVFGAFAATVATVVARSLDEFNSVLGYAVADGTATAASLAGTDQTAAADPVDLWS